MIRVTGVGSLPGTDPRQWQPFVLESLGSLGSPEAAGGSGSPVAGVPYLIELPDRGPGADMIGRAASLLVDLHVDLQPSGWRFVARPGRDQARAEALLSEDLDTLAEAADGYQGPLKIQVAGPWTLVGSIASTRGERVVADPGACRDLVQSLAEGVRGYLARVERLVPGAQVLLQVDEPSLTAVLEGTLATSSGFSRLPAIDQQVVAAGLATVLDAAGARERVVHCCANRPPLPLLRSLPAGISVDTTVLTDRGWEGVAVAVEEGTSVYAGVSVADSAPTRLAVGLDRRWHDLGLDPGSLGGLTVTPSCGLASSTADQARATHRGLVELARRLTDLATQG